jgi:hypothetical protein
MINDHLTDAGTYDLLLHKRDISYTVSQVKNWNRQAGLLTVRYTSTDVPPLSGDNEIPKSYNIKHFHKVFENKKDLQNQMQKISELFHHDALMQNTFVSLSEEKEARISDLDNVLFIPGDGKCPSGLETRVLNIKNSEKYFIADITEASKGSTFTCRWPLNNIIKHTLNIFVRSECNIKLSTLFSALRKQMKRELTDNELVQHLVPFYTYANNAGILLLKNAYVKNFPKSNSAVFRTAKHV